jgi:hypothetical protein
MIKGCHNGAEAFVSGKSAFFGNRAAVCMTIGWFTAELQKQGHQVGPRRGQAFAGHTLAHVGFTAASGWVLTGVSPLCGFLLVTVTRGVGMGLLVERLEGRGGAGRSQSRAGVWARGRRSDRAQLQ